MYTKSQFSSMCRFLPAWTEEYATVAGVGVVMRANSAPAGSVTSEYDPLANSPGLFSTRMRRVRSGFTHAGISSLVLKFELEEGAVVDCVDDLREVCLPLVGAGVGASFETAMGDMVG